MMAKMQLFCELSLVTSCWVRKIFSQVSTSLLLESEQYVSLRNYQTILLMSIRRDVFKAR